VVAWPFAPPLAPWAMGPPWALEANDSARTRATDPAYLDAYARAEHLGVIDSPAAMGWVLQPLAARERQEVAWVALLGTHGQLRRIREIARGTHDRVLVPIPFALRAALDASCKYLILAHNHPSGWAWPSEADEELTDAVSRAADDVGLLLLDHLVLGRGEIFSFREGKLWRINNS
jgi:DNA repair protein RadC